MKRLIICLICLALALCSLGALAEPLKKGDKGDEVKALQQKLIEHNYLAGGADGSFGGKTEKAVKMVQEDAGLEQTGVADEATLEYLENNYAKFRPTKDSDIKLLSLECDTSLMHMLTIQVKNMGRKRITSYGFKLYQCNASKNSLGSFFGDHNKRTKRRRTQYWTTITHSASVESGDTDSTVMSLEEGYTLNFSDGSSQSITWYDKGVYARVVLSEFTTVDGKKHKTNQTLYCKFRD